MALWEKGRQGWNSFGTKTSMGFLKKKLPFLETTCLEPKLVWEKKVFPCFFCPSNVPSALHRSQWHGRSPSSASHLIAIFQCGAAHGAPFPHGIFVSITSVYLQQLTEKPVSNEEIGRASPARPRSAASADHQQRPVPLAQSVTLRDMYRSSILCIIYCIHTR